MWCMGMEIATTFNKIWRIMETRCGVSLFAARDPSALLASPKYLLHRRLNGFSERSRVLYYNFLLQLVNPLNPYISGKRAHDIIFIWPN
jgi:hypothetical protein